MVDLGLSCSITEKYELNKIKKNNIFYIHKFYCNSVIHK